MENNQDTQIPDSPIPIVPQVQNSQINPPLNQNLTTKPGGQIISANLSTETESVRKNHSWISYVLIFISLIQVIFDIISAFSGQNVLLLILGAIFYLATALALFKKPKVGYIMFGAATIIYILAYIVLSYTSSF